MGSILRFLLALSLTLVFTPVHAQTFSIKAESPFNCSRGALTIFPVKLTVSNSGPDFEGSIEIQAGRTGEKSLTRRLAVRVPGGTSASFQTTYPLGSSDYSLNIRLIDKTGAKVADTTLHVSRIPDEGIITCVVGDEASRLNLNGISFRNHRLPRQRYNSKQDIDATSPTYPGYPLSVIVSDYAGPVNPQKAVKSSGLLNSSEALYAPGAYDSADLVFLYGFTPRDASPQARQIIKDYIACGGTVVIVATVDIAAFKDPFYSDILPVEIIGAGQVSLVPGDPPVFLAETKPKDRAKVFSSVNGKALLTGMPFGLGAVFFLGVDLAYIPGGWAGSPDVLKTTLEQAYAVGSSSNISLEPVTAVNKIPRNAPPSMLLMGLFLGAYVIALVPLNYWWTRHRDKQEWTWITTPVIVVFFTLLAWGIGLAMRGGNLVFNEGAFSVFRSNGAVSFTARYGSIFSPAMRQFEVGATGGILLPTSLFHYVEDMGQSGLYEGIVLEEKEDNKPVMEISVPMWTARSVMTSRPTYETASLKGSVTLVPDGLKINIENTSARRFSNCSARIFGRSYAIGDIEPYAKINTNLSSKQGGSPLLGQEISFADEWQNAMKAQQESLMPASLLAYMKNPEQGIELKPAPDIHQKINSLIIELPISAEKGSRRLSSSVAVANLKNGEFSERFITSGAMESVTIWGLNLDDPWSRNQPEKLRIFFDKSSKAAINDLAIYDHTERNWVKIKPDADGYFRISSPARAFSPSNIVWVRASIKPNSAVAHPSLILEF